MLSAEALALLRRLAGGEVVSDQLEAHRELARAGVLVELATFPKGSSFRFTEEGWERREQWLSEPATLRSAS